MDNIKVKVFKLYFALSIALLTIYSYTQIDLNLTLSSNPHYQFFQNQLIYLGYFNRPLSTLIISFILGVLFLNYFLILKFIQINIFKAKDIIHLIIITSIILLISYPAFSYDIFNYIFDARIVAKYGLNPYFYKALDFPSDPWIRFMHWTHRTYPYGPIWLALTVPVYLIGFGKFVITLFNFKLLLSSTYILSTYLLYKILRRNQSKDYLVNTAFFAFNPLIIVETLVSPHNEIVMLMGMYLSFYLLLSKKNMLSLVSLIISGGIKYLSWISTPFAYMYIKKKLTFPKMIHLIYISLILLLIPLIYIREMYSWYFIPLIGLASLSEDSKFIKYLTIGITFATLMRYIPFIYFGDYTATMQYWRSILTFIPILSSVGLYILKSKKIIK